MKRLKLLSAGIVLTFAVISPCFSLNYYIGDGGKDIRLAIYEPQSHGEAVPANKLRDIQNLLTNNLNNFSAITLVDQQFLNETFAAQDLSTGGRYSEEDYIKIGAMVNARYLLLSTVQTLPGNKYRLQLSVIDASYGVSRFTVRSNGTIAEAVYDAAEELLQRLGVELTDEGKQELKKQKTAEEKLEKEAERANRRQSNKTARAEKEGGFEVVKAKFGSKAERSFFGANAYYQWKPNPMGMGGAGIEVEAYAPIIPFLTTGISGRVSILGFPGDESKVRFGEIYKEKYPDREGDLEDNENPFSYIISPVIGFVFPVNDSIRVFADILLDFGNFGYIKGITPKDWFTMSFAAGLQYHVPNKKHAYVIKYRGTMFDKNMETGFVSSIGIGISLWWDH